MTPLLENASICAGTLFDHSVERKVSTPTLMAWSLGIIGFGFALGTYAGLGEAWLAAWKLPVVVLLSVAITLPSLAVFSALTGGRFSIRSSVYVAALTMALGGALLLALAPVMWPFAASSWYLGWSVVVSLGLGVVGLAVAGARVSTVVGAGKKGYGLWLLLLIPVILQMTTTLRPIVVRDAPRGSERMFFLEHFAKAAEFRAGAPD